ncbi:MAG: alginate lyase family protein [Steroidobacteraceae bacterium]
MVSLRKCGYPQNTDPGGKLQNTSRERQRGECRDRPNELLGQLLGRLALCNVLIALSISSTVGAATPPSSVPAFVGHAAPTCDGENGYQAAFGGRRTFLWRPDWLARTKARLTTDSRLKPPYDALIARADNALAGPRYSVIDKRTTPPSGDKHDYMSIGPYWWPDPEHPEGPYIRHDGEVNPGRNTDDFDSTRFDRMSSAVEALGLAYYFTHDARYARKAAELLRTWFLDPATRMNPNAQFAQGVPGRTTGRAEGVLDTFRLLRVIESVGLLAPSKTLTDADQGGLEQWFSHYIDWMTSSPTGKQEQAAGNNHGLWFDRQVMEFALFAHRRDVAKAVLAASPGSRVDRQIQPDGKLPEELSRTRALHYTVFALEALAGSAEIGRCFGVDLWRYQSPDGRGMRQAIDFLASYVGREKEFPYTELHPEETHDTFALLRLAAWAYDDHSLSEKAETLSGGNATDLVQLLIPPQRNASRGPAVSHNSPGR